MNWLLILLETLAAVGAYLVLSQVSAFQRQSSAIRIVILACTFFVIFTVVRYLLPGVTAL